MRRCLTHARYLPARAWRPAATPGRTPGRVGGGVPPPRLDVRAKSSKASKVGRFPSVPSVETHPLSASGVDLGELCARWRAGAGTSGADVVRRLEAMLRGGDARRHLADPPPDSVVDAARAAAPPATPLDDESWRVLLSHKNENLYNAYAMEIDSLCPGSRGLTVGLFALPRPAPASALARLAGLRAAVDPLAVAPTADALVAAVAALPIGDTLGDVPVALYHDCVARHPDRVPSPDLYADLGDVVGGWGGGFKHGVFARFKNPNAPESIDGERRTLRFVVIETAAGYCFGLTTFAPPRAHAKCDWNRKPNNYSAGTQPAVAAAAINAVFNPTVIGGSAASTEAWEEALTRGVIFDPCCGGGTIAHAAWSRGYRAVASDVNPLNVDNARGNLGSFRGEMPAAHAILAAIDGTRDGIREGTRADAEAPDSDAEAASMTMASPVPKVYVQDALERDFDWTARAREALDDPDARVDAVVSNLPFGRAVGIGGDRDGGALNPVGKWGEASAEEMEQLLASLRDVAPRHAFITGTPVAEKMRALGYGAVSEVPICRFGRIHLTVALGEGASARELRPSVNFTSEQASAAKLEGGRVRADAPEWVAAASKRETPGEKANANANANAAASSRPPLRVAVDTSYDQDSQRAIRSVAKQLSECIGVSRRAAKADRAVDVELTFAGWRGTVAAHAVEHFNAARWSGPNLDPRDVQDIFLRGDSSEEGEEASASGSGFGRTAAAPRLVYLSPDAEEVLDDVDADTVYIIGGIVDLAARGVAWSLPKANAAGIRAARLPIREHLPKVTNQILNIDTALKVLCEKYSGKEWTEALEAALPARQQGERPARMNRPSPPRDAHAAGREL